MYLNFVLKSFAPIASVLLILLCLRELGITKKLSPMRASDYVSVIAIFLILYVINAFLIAVFYPLADVKISMVLFGIIPFAIGKAVKYEDVKVYSIIQILCVIFSIVYVSTVMV